MKQVGPVQDRPPDDVTVVFGQGECTIVLLLDLLRSVVGVGKAQGRRPRRVQGKPVEAILFASQPFAARSGPSGQRRLANSPKVPTRCRRGRSPSYDGPFPLVR